jgi:zinc protease
VQLYYSGKFAYGDTNNLRLSALGTILQYRMIDRIREAEGGAYSPKAEVVLTKRPAERYVFSIRFTCAPENVDKLVAAVADEIARLKRDGPSAGDIQKFKAEQARALELQLRSNGFWQQYLAGGLEDEDPLSEILGYTNRLKTVDGQMVQRAATQYLNDKNYIQLVLQSAQR